MSNPETAPSAPTPALRQRRIGGALLFIAALLIISPIAEIASVVHYWDVFSRLGDFDGLRSSVITGEAVLRFVVLAIAPLPLLVLLFERRRQFPQLFLLWLFATPVLELLALAGSYLAFNGSYIPGVTAPGGQEPWIGLVGVIAGCFVATSYMRRSERVRTTFVN